MMMSALLSLNGAAALRIAPFEVSRWIVDMESDIVTVTEVVKIIDGCM